MKPETLIFAIISLVVGVTYCAQEILSVTNNDMTELHSHAEHEAHGVHRRSYKRGNKRDVASATNIDIIVKEHNKYRAAEGASNMNKLFYHNYLASMAEEWALGCKFVHGNPPRTDKPWGWIGQNLYAISVPKLNYTRAILAWYLEKSYYDFNLRKCAPGRICGHYTQVVWWESIYVGCAATICPALADTSFTNAGFIVCNYGPGGNYVGELPYTSGPACSACPINSTCSDNLCA